MWCNVLVFRQDDKVLARNRFTMCCVYTRLRVIAKERVGSFNSRFYCIVLSHFCVDLDESLRGIMLVSCNIYYTNSHSKHIYKDCSAHKVPEEEIAHRRPCYFGNLNSRSKGIVCVMPP